MLADITFVQTFFLTYRSFTTPEIFFQKLNSRFKLMVQSHAEELSNTKMVMWNVLNAISYWIDNHFYDFSNPLISELVLFFHTCVDTREEVIIGNTILQYMLTKKLISRPITRDSRKIQSTNNITTPFDQKTVIQQHFSMKTLKKKVIASVKDFDILLYSDFDIAKQMTLIEFNIYKKIQPKECFKKSWNKKEIAPNIVQLTKRFNDVSSWVSNVILSETNLKKRKDYLRKFIDIAAVRGLLTI